MIPTALLIATLTAAHSTPAAPKDPAAARIVALVEDGKLDEAIDRGRAAVAAHPDDPDVRLALAQALAAKARHPSHVVNVKISEADLAKGQVKVSSGSLADSPLQIGYDAGLFEEAVLHLDAGIARAPSREDLRVLKCFLLTDAARIDRAKAAISEALAAVPHTPALAKTMVAYGVERVKRGDLAGGVTLMQPVAAAFPSIADVQSDYGNALTRLGRASDAFAAFERAVAAAPGDVRTARTRATAAMLLRDYPRARSAWEAVYRLTRSDADSLTVAAAVYAIDPKNSVALFHDLSSPAPSSNSGVADVASLFALAGTAGPGSQAAISLGRGLVQGGQLVLAIPVLDRARRAAPGDSEVAALLEKAYRDLGCEDLAKILK
jgi:tetratricopeptide (TPR) repeat protein